MNALFKHDVTGLVSARYGGADRIEVHYSGDPFSDTKANEIVAESATNNLDLNNFASVSAFGGSAGITLSAVDGAGQTVCHSLRAETARAIIECVQRA